MEIQKEPLETYYDLFEDIGKGQFATVKRCIHKETQAEYAAKFIRKRRGGGRRGAKMEDIQKEIDILSSVSHRNIIRLFEVYETNREVILLLELVSGGELFEYLAEKDKLSEEEASAFVKQILDGLQHLHSKNIAHLDLKPENILLQDKNSTYVKLIDFGLSRVILPNEDHRAMMGTAEFVAPEVVSYDQLTLATDMWSIGVITYILLSGASPFLGDNQQETYHNITAVNYEFDEDYFNGTSEMAKGFIRSLLVKDKRKRATIHDCLKHPWIKPVEKKQRDLRRTSVIKTEHLKKFIARQRWKRSVRVVSLCNRLSRSIQLRRIQSTDTLGSCSEEKKKLEERLKLEVQLCLSAQGGSDDISGCSNDETPDGVALILDHIVASAIAKAIVEEIIQTVLRQLNGSDDNSVEYLKSTPDQRNDEDIGDSSRSVVPGPYVNQVNDQVNLVVGVEKFDETVEVFVEQTDVLSTSDCVKIENDECLKISSLKNWRLSRSKRKLSDLQDIKEENANVLQVTDDKNGTPSNAESTQDRSKDDINLDLEVKDKETTYLPFSVQKTDPLTDVTGADENDNKGVVMSSSVLDNIIAGESFEQKDIKTECDHQSVDYLSEENKDNRVQDGESNEAASFENPIRAENSFTDIILEKQILDNLIQDIIKKSMVIVRKSTILQQVTEGVANAELNTEEYGLDATDNTDVNNYNDNLYDDGRYQQNSHNQQFKTIEPHVTCSKLDNADLTEQVNSNDTDIKGLHKKSITSALPNSKMITEFISGIIEKAKLELVDEKNTELLKKESNAEAAVSQIENNNMHRLSYYQLCLQDQPNSECVGDIREQDSIEKPVYHYDPLHIVSFTVSWDLPAPRDLFDIPEEFDDGDEDDGELTDSISDELRKKITRQRLRKMSLQRKVQAKFIQVTAFSEMTMFRKLRDEKRIESFEMKVLNH